MLHKVFTILGILIFCQFKIDVVAAGTLTANVDPAQVPYGEAVNLQIVYEGSDGNLLQPDLSVLQQDFTIYSTSSSMQSSFVNGASRQIREWQIGLMPKKKGKINIPEIAVGTYKTTPLQVEVLASGMSTAAQATGLTAQNNSGAAQKAEFAAYLTVDNQIPYVQQQINAVLTIEDNRGLQLTGEPAFVNDDNWVIKVLRQPTVENQQGKRIIKFYYAMFPQKSGQIEIPPMQVEGYYMAYEGGDDLQPIGGFFHLLDMDINSVFGVRKPVLLHTEAQTIQVKPIPDKINGQWLPATALNATAKWVDNKPVFKVGETVAREIIITASGVADTQLPEIEFAEDGAWKQYPENPQLTSVVHENEIISQEIIRVVYIPQQGGEQVLPEIRIPWFDVKAQTEKTAVIPAEKVVVSGQVIQPSNQVKPSEISLNSVREQQPTKSEVVPTKKGSNKDIWQYAALLAAFVAGIAVSILLKRAKPQKNRMQQPQYNVSIIAQYLKNKDYRSLQNSLLQWGKEVFAPVAINNINELAQKVAEPEFTRQMEKLNAVLYADKKEDLDEKIIINCIKKYKHKGQNKETIPPLPNLYK